MPSVSPAPPPAPPGRLAMAEILAQRDFLASRFDSRIIDTIPSVVLLLNDHRQIVYANRALVEMLGQDGLEAILGRRPGEIFQCVHTLEGIDGCGTSQACAHCSALTAQQECATGTVSDREGNILVRHGNSVATMNIQVRAVPLNIEGCCFTIIYLQDIGERKTRELMDNIFLHDALNTLNGLIGAASLLHEEIPEEQRELSDMILERSRHLEREIRAQRLLRQAETQTLQITPEAIDPTTVCLRLAALFQSGGYENAVVVCDPGPQTGHITTDSRLLYRVLENLIKNALEASPKGAPVHVGHAKTQDGVRFHVANKGAMPPEVQAQLFQRSFSTKGPGRGLGTYSVKLLTENYLQGQVDFVSDTASGTVFTITLPRTLHPETP